jgi:hypothetical protein
MGAFASVLIARKSTALVFAVMMSGALFYLPYSWSMPAPILTPQYGAPHILYVMLGDPATTICGILDSVDANGSPISGIVYCNGDRLPQDDPRFPRTRRLMRSWT